VSRRSLITAAIVVVATVIVFIGRSQRAAERHHNLDGIAIVRSLVGEQIAKPDNYRVSPGLYCLLYGVGARTFALELCSDPQGRLVEAADRRGALPKFYSVASEPSVANETVSTTLVKREIERLSSGE
jgi:hypothetical protein